jgi:hypothetical protein
MLAVSDLDVRSALKRYDAFIIEGFSDYVRRIGLVSGLADRDLAAVVEVFAALFEGLQARAASGTFVSSSDRVSDIAVQVVKDALGAARQPTSEARR